MTKRFEVDGVLFDLDGTLLDSVGDLWEATNRTLRDLAQPERSLAEVMSFIGNGVRSLVNRAVTEGRGVPDHLAAEALPRFMRHYAEVNGLASTLYPGVLEGLRILRDQDYRIGCVTNKSEAFIRPVFDTLGITGFFGSLVGGDTLPQRKPEPEPLLHACYQLGIKPSRTLMVGDSINDALAARRAGIPVLLVTYGYSVGTPLESIDCDGLISSVKEVPAYLSRVR